METKGKKEQNPKPTVFHPKSRLKAGGGGQDFAIIPNTRPKFPGNPSGGKRRRQLTPANEGADRLHHLAVTPARRRAPNPRGMVFFGGGNFYFWRTLAGEGKPASFPRAPRVPARCRQRRAASAPEFSSWARRGAAAPGGTEGRGAGCGAPARGASR